MIPVLICGFGAVGAFWAVVYATGANGTHQANSILAYGGIAIMAGAVLMGVIAVKARLAKGP